MPCRAGITTRPEERKQTWKNSVVGFKNCKILRRCKTQKEAQDYEEKYAKRYGCRAHRGGDNASGTWHVYYFEFTKEK